MAARRKCKEVMTNDPVCCLTTDTVEKAAQVMRRENVGPVPIVDNMKSQRLRGIITDRDIAIKVVAEGLDPFDTSIETVMQTELVTCRPEDEVDVALEAMAQHQLRRIPVVDDNGSLRGIIAQADVATRLHSPDKVGAVVEKISREQ